MRYTEDAATTEGAYPIIALSVCTSSAKNLLTPCAAVCESAAGSVRGEGSGGKDGVREQILKTERKKRHLY